MTKKLFAALLAALMLLQTLAVGVSAATADYTGAILAAVNTNYGDLTQTFSARLIGPAYTNGETSGNHAVSGHGAGEEGLLCGADDTELEPLSPAEAARKQAALGNVEQATAAEYHVGDTRTVHSSFRTEFSSDNVDLECVYVGEYCTVWNEIGGGFSVSSSVTLGEDFDKLVVREFEIFGDKRIDTDGDGKTALFVHELDSSYGGYFSVSDLVDSLGRIGNVWFRYKGNGNACDCVHLDGTSLSTVTHEFQHYLQRCWQFFGKNNLTYVPNELESYINEGFSECASYLLLGTNSRVWWFEDVVNDPETYSLVNWSFDSAAYAAGYVFCQYLRTSYAQLPGVKDGAEIYKTIMEIRANKLVRNTLSIAADLLYPKELYPNLKTTDSRCRQLLIDFWLAVLCKEEEGRRGFLGEKWADPIEAWVQDELPEDGSIGIRSGMAAFYYIYSSTPEGIENGTARITKAGKDMAFVGVTDTGYKVKYDWNNGLWESESYLRIKDVETVQTPDRRFPGKTFLGWNVTPNAASAIYSGGTNVTLTKSRETVLYAVWEDAAPLDDGQTVNVYNFLTEKCFRFIPEQSGYYSLKTAYGVTASLYSEGEELSPDSVEWFEDSPGSVRGTFEESYYLEAGKPYDIYGIRKSYLGSALRINYVSQHYTLTYDANLDAVSEPIQELRGRVDYTVADAREDIRTLAMTKGLEFMGWAKSAEADSAQFLPDDTVVLDEDTTLYAVWQPIAKLTTENDAALEYRPDMNGRLFSVTPESDGTYRLSSQAPLTVGLPAFIWDSLYVYNSDGKLLLERDNEPCSIDLSLRGGKTYFFLVYLYGKTSDAFTATFSLQKISDKSSARLIFNMSDTDLKHPYLILSDGFVYTVPRLSPVTSEKDTFAGWKGAFSVYTAGDELEIIVDTELSPDWAPQQTTNRFASALRFAAGKFRFYLQLAVLSLRRDAKLTNSIETKL